MINRFILIYTPYQSALLTYPVQHPYQPCNLGDDISEGGSAVSALTGATGAGRPPRNLGQEHGLGLGQAGQGQGLGGVSGGRSKGQGKANRDGGDSDVVSLPAILETPGGRATAGR